MATRLPMAKIARLLANRRWRQSFTIKRQKETVDPQTGRNILTAEQVEAEGVIYPSMPEELERLPEASRVKEVKTVVTTTPLTAGSPGTLEDTVIYNGTPFDVIKVEIWADYGFYVGYIANSDMSGEAVRADDDTGEENPYARF